MTLSISIPDHVLSRDVDGELIILDLNAGSYSGLDGVGAAFWKALEESGSFETCLTRLLGEFDVERERLEKDLRELVDVLKDKNLIKVS